ncbi:unnamed protein product [Schistosoma rodhaini]|uniref:Pre-rRNA-processing protein TSR1 homolog n=1 Tax=Schistosoma rodhaini TaxID=6188 RepID=A0AA85ENA5_9TREM|nr:unnamed protein product [Schistosoma rodhaini]
MARAPHRSGPLKQQNKKHKGVKRSTDKNPNSHRVTKNKILNKDQRRLLSKQLRIQKRLEVKKLEASRGTKENPIACVLIPLSSSVPTHLAQLLLQTCEPNTEVIKKPESCLQNVVTIHSRILNKYFDLICAYSDDLFGCLDLANFADWLILLVPSNPTEIPDSVHELLSAIYAQGFTNASYAVLSSSSNLKELKQILECRFPVPESTIHQLNSSTNALHLLRHIASTNPSSFHAKGKNAKVAGQSTLAHTGARYRTRLLVDSIDLISENDAHDDITESEVAVCLRGRLHGAPLFLSEELDQNGSVLVGPRVHLTGWGDFPLIEAKWIDSFHLQQKWQISDLNAVKNISTKCIPKSTSVNLTNENEDCEEDSLSDEMSVDDSHQSTNENHWDATEEISDHLESELSGNSDIECTSIASHTAHTMAASATSTFSSAQLAKFRAARMEEMFPDEVETPPNTPASERFVKYCGLPRFQSSVWPAEKNWLPKHYQNIACFRNYHRNRRTMIRYIEQKLANFQSEYKPTGNIFKYIPPGVDVELLLRPVSRDLGESILSHHTFLQPNEARKPSDPRPHPLLVWSLLPHETQMSVCHFTMFRRASAIHAVSDLIVIANAANKITESRENGICALEFGEEASTQVEREDKSIHDALISHRNKIDGKHNGKALYDPKMPIPPEAEPIKSKDLMLIQAGIRRFVAAPIYSAPSNPREKAKFEPFFPASESSTVATVYAPVMYSPVNILQFRIRVTEDEDGELSSPYVGELVATGSLRSVDPSHLIIKRIFLSGHPYKINQRHVVVRYMFHNPADVIHFQSVQLQTKSGAVGHIKEPVGTHGHMKCVFDRPILANDVALMPLYKRVFPKYVYEPEVSKYLANNDRTNDHVVTDSGQFRYVSSDVLQLRKKSISNPAQEKMDQDESALFA